MIDYKQGPHRKRRVNKKRQATYARRDRWHWVHARGCVYHRDVAAEMEPVRRTVPARYRKRTTAVPTSKDMKS